MNDWHIFKKIEENKNNEPHDGIDAFLRKHPPPRWRDFKGEIIRNDTPLRPPQGGNFSEDFSEERGETFQAEDKEVEMVNAALYLRRPLLVTGKPGVGKSSLAYAVAYQLRLGKVLHWPITTRTILKDGLYHYDAIGRLQELQIERLKKGEDGSIEPPDMGQYIRLGPLGTAFLPSERPRVLLIDEIDKSDIDLPNDLLNIFEEGSFEIPELSRLARSVKDAEVLPHDAKDHEDRVVVREGKVLCRAFPFVVLTSNAERELPAPFLRRCLRLDIDKPEKGKLTKIVQAHFGNADEAGDKERNHLIQLFLNRRETGDLATDQLLNAIYLTTQGIDLENIKIKDKESLLETVLKHLNSMGTVGN